MRAAPLLLLPLAAAFRLPSAGDAFSVAADMLGAGAGTSAPDTVLSPASDITLASIPDDEHYVILSAMHPVRWRSSGARAY